MRIDWVCKGQAWVAQRRALVGIIIAGGFVVYALDLVIRWYIERTTAPCLAVQKCRRGCSSIIYQENLQEGNKRASQVSTRRRHTEGRRDERCTPCKGGAWQSSRQQRSRAHVLCGSGCECGSAAPRSCCPICATGAALLRRSINGARPRTEAGRWGQQQAHHEQQSTAVFNGSRPTAHLQIGCAAALGKQLQQGRLVSVVRRR